MTLSVAEIVEALKQWPHRRAGSDEETEARETLITILSAVPGLEISEEGFLGPLSPESFVWLVFLSASACLIISSVAPLYLAAVNVLLFLSFVAFIDWRRSPAAWFGAQRIDTNLVASKGRGERLIVLFAELDSPPQSFLSSIGGAPFLRYWVYASVGVMALAWLLPVLEAEVGAGVLAAKVLVILLLLISAGLYSLGRVVHGFDVGANSRISGVAAAMVAASKLWRHIPVNTEVRLVIAGASAGSLGAQQYWRAHREELRFKQTHVISFDRVGCGDIGYVIAAGGLTETFYDGPMVLEAANVARQSGNSIAPIKLEMRETPAVWFARDNISALAIAGVSAADDQPRGRDSFDAIDLETITAAATFGEQIVRQYLSGKK